MTATRATDLDHALLDAGLDLDPQERASLVQAGRVTPPPPDVLDSVTAALRAQARRDVVRFRRRRMVTSLAGVAAASAIVAGPVLGLGTTEPPAQASAAPFLQRVAAVVDTRTNVAPSPYWYTQTLVHYDDNLGDRTFTRSVWAGRTAPSVILDPESTDGIPETSDAPGRWSYGDAWCDWACLDDLPTDPALLAAQLRAALARQGNPDPDTQLFAMVGELLQESPAQPSLRRALYEVMATIPGTQVRGASTDAIGRAGVLVVRRQSPESGSHSYELSYLVDPADGRLLETANGGYRGTVTAQGGVDAVGEKVPATP